MTAITSRPFLALTISCVLAGCAGTLAATSATASSAEVIECVSGGAGLALTVVTDKDRKTACATGRQVADAYAAQGFSEKLVTVSAGSEEWTCQEKQGGPNTYQECVNGMEMVHLSS
ncbi:hypothetical protein [Nonomuraea insulae]|uniref:Lipoprotein n=1 Tax=Nonomuraea insulae TaxID=1616787 RepID=A0ABW1CTJ9_9ACTN